MLRCMEYSVEDFLLNCIMQHGGNLTALLPTSVLEALEEATATVKKALESPTVNQKPSKTRAAAASQPKVEGQVFFAMLKGLPTSPPQSQVKHDVQGAIAVIVLLKLFCCCLFGAAGAEPGRQVGAARCWQHSNVHAAQGA